MELQELPVPATPGSLTPNLSVDADGVLLSWLEPDPRGGHSLRLSRLGGGGVWDGPATVVRGDSFFVNWADFPSVRPVAEGVLAAHWLVRGPEGGYDYGIRVVRSNDGGRSWSEPWIPHDDGTPTEHGFVSLFALDRERMGVVWLDGRNYARVDSSASTGANVAGGHAAAEPEDSGNGGPEMTLRFRSAPQKGKPGPEVVLDARVCDCCQTDVALAEAGPVVVYRDRSADEIRDISIVRWTEGSWTPPSPVHRDGWQIAACPVNGPSVAAAGRRLAVAWFTAAGDTPRVNVAFSDDGGASFSQPVRADDGNPLGRVAVQVAADGRALVTWLEATGEGAEVRVRWTEAGHPPGRSARVAASAAARASGFPRMVLDGSGGVVFAWTDPSEPSMVRAARARLRP